jgi:hypothetical protein
VGDGRGFRGWGEVAAGGGGQAPCPAVGGVDRYRAQDGQADCPAELLGGVEQGGGEAGLVFADSGDCGEGQGDERQAHAQGN